MELLNVVDCLRETTPENGNRKLKLYDEVRKFEADLIRAALVRTGGNQSRAARLLGVSTLRSMRRSNATALPSRLVKAEAKR
jgi:transcriptional regulator with PAS, ATPase and Fis domain